MSSAIWSSAVVLVVVWTLVIVGFTFWMKMLIDCTQRKFPNGGDKIVWMLVIIFLLIIGAFIYYFTVKRKQQQS